MSKKLRIAVLSLFAALTVALCGGCGLPTAILSETDAPDVVFGNFIDALKRGDYSAADSLLAENASIKPENSTGYGFFEEYAAASLAHLQWQTAGTPEYEGIHASLNVSITAMDKKPLLKWIRANLTRIEHEYLLENGLRTIDTDNREEVDKLLSKALAEYAAQAETTTETVTVRFVYASGGWKIIGGDSLVAAIFGGVEDEK